VNNEIPRLRMFAGPNGSGKSTFKSIIRPELLGIFINPDEIEQQIRDYDFLDLKGYQVDPTINISRVRYRVKMGGHSVPEDKIVSRYQRSLDLLIAATQFTNRAYIFDNSTHEHIWLAEVTDGHLLEMKTDQVPAWFKKAFGSKFNIGKG